MRDVSDGITEPVRAMLNRVLPKAQIAIQVDANGRDTSFIETDGNQFVSKPVTVLTNGNTACLAEIFAIGLRDFAKASVVGSSTAGKSQLQTTQSFKDGSAVSISTANIVPVESDDLKYRNKARLHGRYYRTAGRTDKVCRQEKRRAASEST